jgi:hypothetical protein
MTTEVRETEEKYEVEGDVALPSFAGLPRVASVSEPELQTLTAEYYGTDDLRLHFAPEQAGRRPSGAGTRPTPPSRCSASGPGGSPRG